MVSAEVNSIVSKWAYEEVAPWIDVPFDDHLAQDLSQKNRSIYILDISSGIARFRKKDNIVEGLHYRAEFYRQLIQSAIDPKMQYDCSIVIEVEDDSRVDADIPIFSFQRKKESRMILLPDIDFFGSDFYANKAYFGIPDTEPFAEKLPNAIFIGSTTGAGLIDRGKLDRNEVPRVKLARYALGQPNIIVRLPQMLQITEEARNILVREGFGGANMEWRDQIRNRFLISIDGNGATCSRVYLSLISNCVLLKYRSPNLLHYFKGLENGKHYVEIEKEQDIADILVRDQMEFANIAKEGRKFAEIFLTRDAIAAYSRRLLGEYSAVFGRATADNREPRRRLSGDDQYMLTLDQIGLKTGTDKSSAVHNFLGFYESLLSTYKEQSFLLVEIGVYMGHSLLTWAEFFPRAQIVGVDIDPEALKVRKAENAEVFLGDASRLETLDAIAAKYGAPTIVVEDGSHRWHHQIETLRYLWPRIRPGGVFVMEDIHTSFPDAEDEYRGASEISCYDYLLELNKWVVGNRYMSKSTPKDGFISNYWSTIESIHFYRGTCLLFKKIDASGKQ